MFMLSSQEWGLIWIKDCREKFQIWNRLYEDLEAGKVIGHSIDWKKILSWERAGKTAKSLEESSDVTLHWGVWSPL